MAWCLQQTLVLTDVGGFLRLSEALSERKNGLFAPLDYLWAQQKGLLLKKALLLCRRGRLVSETVGFVARIERLSSKKTRLANMKARFAM